MSREIPEVSVNNYAAIFAKPIFKNQNGEWYREVGYEDALDIIRENFLGVRKSFVAIGYYLKHIKEKELYKEGGYLNIWECAKIEFGLSSTAASNYMKMNDIYSVNGDTPILDDKYSGFNKSQLQEMLALTSEKREEIAPEQTVSEIREIAKEEKKNKEPTEEEIRWFYNNYVEDMDDKPRDTLKERLKQKYRHTHVSYQGFSWYGTARGVHINQTDEITWAQLVKLIDRYISQKEAPVPIVAALGEEEWQLPGQMEIEDYLGVVPEDMGKAEAEDDSVEETEPDSKTDCPPGIMQCMRQQWECTPEKQKEGAEECGKCWEEWEKRDAILRKAVVSEPGPESQEEVEKTCSSDGMAIQESIKYDLKILPQYFEDVISGRRKFELRKNDRDYKAGDMFILREWEPDGYTGRDFIQRISYILKDCPEYGLMDGYVIFGW